MKIKNIEVDVPAFRCTNDIRGRMLDAKIEGEMTLEEYEKMGRYYSLSDNCEFSFTKGLTPNSYKVIFNDPATILFVGDKKYVVKAHDEEFDEEKGLSMALLRCFGISHLDLKRILKNAKNQKKTEEKEDENLNVKVEKIVIETAHKNKEKESTVYYENISSPYGKHRGKPYNFVEGDFIVVRDCYSYKQENREDVEPMLNKKLEIADYYVDRTNTLYYVIEFEGKRLLFSGSELEPIWED